MGAHSQPAAQRKTCAAVCGGGVGVGDPLVEVAVQMVGADVGVMGSGVYGMLNFRVDLLLRTGMQWAWGATPGMKRVASFSLSAVCAVVHGRPASHH